MPNILIFGDSIAYGQYDKLGGCGQEKILFVDLFNQLKPADFPKFLIDGLHPNSLGHEKIFNLVYPIIDRIQD